MDTRTVQYYDDNAEAVFARYQEAKTGIARYFRLAFPPGSEVLDILIREECKAYGAEPSARMREVTEARLPHLAGRIYSGSLPGLSRQIERNFDGIFCSGVFMHIPEEQHFDAAFDIRNLLKPQGRLLLSVTGDREGLDAARRDEYGRLHTRLVPEALDLLFEPQRGDTKSLCRLGLVPPLRGSTISVRRVSRQKPTIRHTLLVGYNVPEA